MLLILAGLAVLTVGAELVVRYGARLARRVGVPPMLVGLTIVSLGTSLPELAIGIDAVRSHAGSLAVGNIAGTNVVNLLLILGLSAAIRPVFLGMQTLRLDVPAMALAGPLVFAFAADGTLTALEGAILAVAAVAYTLLLIRQTRREDAPVVAEAPAVARQILYYTVATVLMSLALWPAARTGWLYPAVVAAAGAWMTYEAIMLLRRANAGLRDAQLVPMRLFHTTNSYLALIAVAAAIDPLIFG